MRRVLPLALLLAASPAVAQWQIVTPAPAKSDMHSVYNVGNGAAWASGSNGTILRTTDSGAHWQLCAVPPDAKHLDLRGIQAFDASTAFVISSGKGALSRLYKTTDGCQTWTLLFTNPKADQWDGIALGPLKLNRKGLPEEPSGPLFILADPVATGFLVNFSDFTKAHFMVWVMKKPWKNGEKLVLLRNLPPAKPGEIASTASNSILFPVLYPPLIFFPAGLGIAINDPRGARWLQLLENLGEDVPSWHSSSIVNKAGCPSFAVTSIAFAGHTGVAVGGDPAKPNLATNNEAYTDNGGADWNSCLSDSPPHGFRSAVAYDSVSKTWITVGPNGTDISTDGGRNWRPLRPDPAAGDLPDSDQHWTALSLPYAVGPNGRIGILRKSVLLP